MDERYADLSRCLFVPCSLGEHVTFFSLSDEVGNVYDAATLGELEPESLEDEIKPYEPLPKKVKRSSGGSKTSSEAAMDVFKEVMTAHVPAKERNLPSDADSFFAAVMLSDEQKVAILAELPASPAAPSLAFLASFDKETLELCGLAPLQVRTWLLLGSKVI